VVLVDDVALAESLALPETWRVIGVHPLPLQMSIVLVVEGPDLPEVLPGCEAPIVQIPDTQGSQRGKLISRPDDEAANALVDRFRAIVREAIADAIQGCDHTDEGGPIYTPVRACADCSAGAVLDLFAGPGGLEVVFPGPGREQGVDR
jgi:hypothetical protein